MKVLSFVLFCFRDATCRLYSFCPKQSNPLDVWYMFLILILWDGILLIRPLFNPKQQQNKIIFTWILLHREHFHHLLCISCCYSGSTNSHSMFVLYDHISRFEIILKRKENYQNKCTHCTSDSDDINKKKGDDRYDDNARKNLDEEIENNKM